jgi:hypothetical protein
MNNLLARIFKKNKGVQISAQVETVVMFDSMVPLCKFAEPQKCIIISKICETAKNTND